MGWAACEGHEKQEVCPPTANETRHGSEQVLRSLLFCPPFRNSFNVLAYDLLCPHCRIVCRTQRNIVGQPDIEVKPVLDVFRKELGLEVRSCERADQQEYERTQ